MAVEHLLEADRATVIGLRWELRLFGRYVPAWDPAEPEYVAAAYLLYAREAGIRPMDDDSGLILYSTHDADPDIARAERMILLDLATGGPLPINHQNYRSREFRLTPQSLAAAIERLTEDWLILVDSTGTITARYPGEAPTVRQWPADLAQRRINQRPGSAVAVGRVDRSAPAPTGLPLAQPLADLVEDSAGDGGGIGGLAVNGSSGETSADLRGRSVADPVDRRPVDSARGEKPSTGERSGGSTTPSSASSPTDHPRSTGADGPDRPAADPVLRRTVRAVLAALVSAGTPLPRSTIRNRWLSGPQKKRLAEALDAAVAAGVVAPAASLRGAAFIINPARKADVVADVAAVVDEVLAAARAG
ncbi:hypothetical protein KIH27_02055 [Mycobacterium sp. M1]|uniref:Uncharacterized protein n=1 Tax=Mycolicibacter acidiphilus TaxID=2835306 RepID=A0ABS5RDK7_9MYCO|nr:hypothetical protein [Mycolicibacter acidiphilus]MBS9532368.1 hypothetical protein [Mycolicibacter acidiphilus]